MASRAIEEQGTQNHPQYLSGLSRALFRQPFSKGLYKSWRHKLLKPNIDFLKLFYYNDINSQ